MSHRPTDSPRTVPRRTRRAGPQPTPASRYAETSARWVIGVYSFAALITSFAWIISPLRHGRGFTWWEITADLLNIPSTHTLPSAITMIVLVSGLIARKRAALYAVIAFEALGALLALHSAVILFFPAGIMPKDQVLSSGVDTLSAVLACALVPFLISIRSAFPAHIGRLSWVGAVATAIGGITVTTALLWYLSHVGWWPALRNLTPWDILMHGLLGQRHAGVHRLPRIRFLSCRRAIPACPRLSCPRRVGRGERAPHPRTIAALRGQRLPLILRYSP